MVDTAIQSQEMRVRVFLEHGKGIDFSHELATIVARSVNQAGELTLYVTAGADGGVPPEVIETIERGEFEPGQRTSSAKRAIRENPGAALHIIALLRRQVSASASVADQATAANMLLAELIACKDLKDSIVNSENAAEAHARDDEYRRRKLLAWAAARAHLIALQVIGEQHGS